MRYYPEGDLLFAKSHLSDVLDAHFRSMLTAIDEIPGERLLGTDPNELADYYEAEYRVEVPSLDAKSITVEQLDQKVDVSKDSNRFIRDRNQPFYVDGTRVTFHVPFTGDKALLKMRPSTWSMNPPRAIIGENEILVRYETTDHSPQELRQAFDQVLAQIEQHLSTQRSDVEPRNSAARGMALDRIEARRTKLLADQEMVSGLGFPIRRRDGAPTTYTVPTTRKRPPMPSPKAGTSGTRIDPVLSNEAYEDILGIMDNMVTVMELSPGAFQTMGEEDLRTHFLVQLNGQYEGNATGETFNYEGKTDILIKHEGRNLFVAECLIWDGPKTLTDKIDQLLGYTSWRDTKTAILVFSRRKDFSAVLNQIPGVVEAHDNVVDTDEVDGETRFRYTVRHRDDPDRLLTLTVLVYNIPTGG